MYRNILDFVQQETEGGDMDPLDVSWAHIPCDEVQVSGPRRDASRIEFATVALASREQVIMFSFFQFKPIFYLAHLTVYLSFVESGPISDTLLLGANSEVLQIVSAFSTSSLGTDGLWALLVHP